jgi:hypothetical protein
MMRDEATIRKQLLKDCQRPEFARLARYTKALGDDTGETVTRPSVKFVEAALQRWGRVDVDILQLDDDPKARRIRVEVQDLETAMHYSKTLLLSRITERPSAGKKDRVLSVTHRDGHQIFQIAATEDDMTALEADQVSVAIRQFGLRILPADLVADCMREVARTLFLAGDAASAEAPPAEPPEPRQTKAKGPARSRSKALAAALKKGKAGARPASRSRSTGDPARKLGRRK